MRTTQILEEYRIYVAIILLFNGISSAGRIKRQNDERTETMQVTTIGNDGESTDGGTVTPPSTCGVKPTIENRVIGGEKTIRGSWPWMAAMFIRTNDGTQYFICGGSLVTNRHVITAAHCTIYTVEKTDIPPEILLVRLGAYNISNLYDCNAIDAKVEEVRQHESFNSYTYKNDIAVLKLDNPVTFSKTISPVCLPFDGLVAENITEKPAVLIGYGTTKNNGTKSNALFQTVIFIQSQEFCISAYADEIAIDNSYLCAGMANGSRDACTFDSGGPLMIQGEDDDNYYLIGIVSFGWQCGDPTHPGVYTRVTEYLEWLPSRLSD